MSSTIEPQRPSEHGGDERALMLGRVSTGIVRLHKRHFGRGPTNAHSYLMGNDVLVCVLRDVLTSAERLMVEGGQQQRVRDFRNSFHDTTAAEVIAEVETVTERRVLAFAYAIDPDSNVLFKNFVLASEDRFSGITRGEP